MVERAVRIGRRLKRRPRIRVIRIRIRNRRIDCFCARIPSAVIAPDGTVCQSLIQFVLHWLAIIGDAIVLKELDLYYLDLFDGKGGFLGLQKRGG